MASTTESIGRLITNEVLLYGERQLLRNRDQSEQQQQPQDPPAPPASAPISHNDKAVASVLLTLLDETLDASADRMQVAGDPVAARPGGGDAGSAQNRVAAQYAEADAVFRPDLPTPQNTISINPTSQQILLAAASSTELRMAMQSAFLAAAGRVQSEDKTRASANSRRRGIGSAVDSSSPIRVGAGIFALIGLAIFLAATFAR